MRIRKRWPVPTPTPPPSSSSSSPPPPSSSLGKVTPQQATATPDLLSTRPPHLLPSSKSQSPEGGLHRLADLSVVQIRSRISPPRPRDSPNPNLLLQRPDLQLTIIRRTDGWICAGTEKDVKPDNKGDSDCCDHMHQTPSPSSHLQDSQAAVVGSSAATAGGTGQEHVEDEGLAIATNQRNENNLGANTSVGISASSSALSHQEGERWCEGEKAFPLKKRRGSYDRKISEQQQDTIKEEEKKMKTRVRSKVTKKWVDEDDENEEENEDENDEGDKVVVVMNGKGGKKRGSVGVIMEGSRCSRVNGRGWRCCQQTLVGYSLCEHHLGKGRLRSMTSVRNRASTIASRSKNIKEEKKEPMKNIEHEPWEDDEENDDDDDEDEKPLVNTRKKKKIGIVKARSISSLLGQTHVTPALATLPPSSDPTAQNMVR